MAVKDIFEAVLAFNLSGIVELISRELESGSPVGMILDEGLIGGMDEVGRRFSSGELFVPEMLMAAMTMKAGLEVLKPHLTNYTTFNRGTVVIGTVKGDLHDIGKNVVAMMLEGAGFRVVDLGIDVSAETFLRAAKENEARVVALSALLTTTLSAMEFTVKTINRESTGVKTIVGGGAVTKNFANKIEADSYSDSAPGAVEMVRRLMAS